MTHNPLPVILLVAACLLVCAAGVAYGHLADRRADRRPLTPGEVDVAHVDALADAVTPWPTRTWGEIHADRDTRTIALALSGRDWSAPTLCYALDALPAQREAA